MDALEQRIKEKLLEGLVEHMDAKMGDDLAAKFPKKSMEVSVAAPDKEKLAEGLDHAKHLAAEVPMQDEESDEDRLMALMGDDDKDDGDDEDDDLKGL